MSLRPRPFHVAVAFAFVAAAILLSRPPVTQWSPDCASKYLQLIAIRFDHGLRFDIPYAGRPFDPNLHAVPIGESYYDRVGGEIHMAWPALFAVVTWPFWKVFGWFGIFVLPIGCGAISVALTGLVADRIRPGTGWIASLLVAVVTPVLVYSTLYWEHTIALALELSALVLVLDFAARPRRWRLLVGGILTGLGAAGFRGDVAVFAVALFGAVFLVARGRERWVVPPLVGAGFAIGCIPGAFLNLTLNGHISPPNAVNNTQRPSFAYLESVHFVGIVPHILVGKTVPSELAWQTTLAVLVLVAAFYAGRRLPAPLRLALLVAAVVALGATSLRELDATRDGAFHGWLAMCPVLALGLLRSEAPLDDPARTGRRVVALSAAFVLTIVCVTIGTAYPNGWASDHNLEWGPRYWLVVFPLMAVLVAVNGDALLGAFRAPGVAAAWRWVGVGAAVGLTVVSFLFIRLGLVRIRRMLVEQGGFRGLLLERPEEPLLTDTFAVSALAPEDFESRPSFYIRFQNPEWFAPWLAGAVANGLSGFGLATFAGSNHPFLRQDVSSCGCSLKVESIDKSGGLTMIHVRVLRPGADTR
ncbi:MAG TPA: hypothetical protein VHV30_03265 [Polyangiaceae bacterium]|nr:hypothetical protein [Polyangiaceae bacterium]